MKLLESPKFQVNINQTSFFFGIGLMKMLNSLQCILGNNYEVKVETKISTSNPLFILKRLKNLNVISNMVDIPDVMTNARLVEEAKKYPNPFHIIHLLLWRLANVGSEKARFKSLEQGLKYADKQNGQVKLNLSTLEFDYILEYSFKGNLNKFFTYFSNLAIRGNYTLKIGIEIDWDKYSIAEFTEKILALSKNVYPNVNIGFDFDPVHQSQAMRKQNPLITNMELENELIDFFVQNHANIFCIHIHDAIFSENIRADKIHIDEINLRGFFKRMIPMYETSVPLVIELNPILILKMLIWGKNKRLEKFVNNYITN